MLFGDEDPVCAELIIGPLLRRRVNISEEVLIGLLSSSLTVVIETRMLTPEPGEDEAGGMTMQLHNIPKLDLRVSKVHDTAAVLVERLNEALLGIGSGSIDKTRFMSDAALKELYRERIVSVTIMPTVDADPSVIVGGKSE